MTAEPEIEFPAPTKPPLTEAELAALNGNVGNPEPFAGQTHDEVLALELEGERHLVDNIVEVGVVGVIAGIPETHKSWLAHAIAVRVARGQGEILGQPVIAQGPVGYFWQDDSRRNEADRVKTFERVHQNPPGLPLTWFLNAGLELPRDLARLRVTVEELGLALVILDSFYNVAAVDLKYDAGQIAAALKAQICDPTEATVIFVDHMPWANDANRGRLRAYGDVFKGAATRFGIYIDAEHKKLWVEARGNNIRGFKRSPAYWDADALELRLVDTTAKEEDEAELDDKVLAWLIDHPGEHASKTVRDAVCEAMQCRPIRVDGALERLKSRDEVRDLRPDTGTKPGRSTVPHQWIASIHAASTSSPLDGTKWDEKSSGVLDESTSSRSSHPRRGDEVGSDEVERLAELGREMQQ
jgi:hypothetical protein